MSEREGERGRVRERERERESERERDNIIRRSRMTEGMYGEIEMPATRTH